MRYAFVTFAALAALVTAACNTVDGASRDVAVRGYYGSPDTSPSIP